MKRVTLLAALLLTMTAEAQIGITRIKRQLETSAPQDIQLNLRHGETVDYELQFLSYRQAMDITGATVTLHATTNGMPDGTSFQISGTAGSNGTATVRIVTDEWLPYGLTSGTWTMEVSQPTLSRIMRASGSLRISGLYYPSTNSPLPVTWSTNLWSAISGIQSKTSNWDTAFSWGNHASSGYLTSELDPGIPAAISSAVAQAGTNTTAALVNSNNWNMAYSWGNHAGLYRDISWVPTWSEVSGKPSTFAPEAHTQAWSTITNPPTITVNGSTGTLSSNLSFTVTGLSSNAAISIANAAVHGSVLTNQLWFAPNTNIQIRIFWDTTNGTFAVEETTP